MARAAALVLTASLGFSTAVLLLPLARANAPGREAVSVKLDVGLAGTSTLAAMKQTVRRVQIFVLMSNHTVSPSLTL